MSSENALELDQRNDAVEVQSFGKPGVCVHGDEEVSLKLNSNSAATHEEEVSRVPVHVEETTSVSDGGVSVFVDFSGSHEARVSKGVDEANEFSVCEIKHDGEKSETVDNRFNMLNTEEKRDSGCEEKRKVELVSEAVDNSGIDAWNDEFDKKEHEKKGDVSDYDSILSMFDQFAANGKSEAVGYGYDIGDMVWGKVKSHPWWPGFILSEAFATSSVRRTKREGHVLVAFFGDSSYGWFDPAELIPFEPYFAEKSRQTNSRTFLKSVEEAVDEMNRRRGLGLVCRCRSPYNFRPINTDGYFAVEVDDYEAGIYSSSQIKRARDSFHPGGMLDFIKQLALTPMTNEFWSISFIQNKATVLAFRKAVFEEFDETYAQAFGAQPVRPVPRTAPLEPTRAPLSGRLVIAEALGKEKSTWKPKKSKDQLEYKYLLKRRDETIEPKIHKISHTKESSSGLSRHESGSVLPVKGMQPGVVGPASHSSTSAATESLEQSVTQQVAIDEPQGQEQLLNVVTGGHCSVVTDTKLNGEDNKMHIDSAKKKAKVHKRPVGEMNSESSVAVENIKKIKKDLGRRTSFDKAQTPTAAGKGGLPRGKVSKKLAQTSSVPRENIHVNYQANDDAARKSTLPDLVGMEIVAGDKNFQLELPQLLHDLCALALNPFPGAESCPATIRQIILRFRSLVYQKSLSLLEPNESEPKEACLGALPSVASFSDNFIVEASKDVLASKSPKPRIMQEDPTKGGGKHCPSDRQEEMAAKKKKKTNHLKVSAEKKTAQKIPFSERGDGRETSVKSIARVPERKPAKRAPEVEQRFGKGIVGKPVAKAQARLSGSEFAREREQLEVKSANPTMLIMKFAPGAALPSSAELRAKFARFGPLDLSGLRVFWTTSTCRVVFRQKRDALSALAAVNEGTVFVNTKVRSNIREVVEVETPETESTKVQREDPYGGTSQSRDPPVLRHWQAGNPQQPVQLKSCLKRPSGDEGLITAGGSGSGSVRGRVKFLLGGDGSKTIADDGASSHAFNDNTTENFQIVVPPHPPLSSILPPVTALQFPIARPINFPHTEMASTNVQNFSTTVSLSLPIPGSANSDITQQMISLLSKCKDVVNNLTGELGYVPYHPL